MLERDFFMNYYFPYQNIPINTTKTGLLSRIFKNGINWSTILTNTQKALNIVNQTIPVIKQMGPVMNNAKTMFRVMNEFKKVETNTTPNKKQEQKEQPKKIEEIKNFNNPTFFQ